MKVFLLFLWASLLLACARGSESQMPVAGIERTASVSHPLHVPPADSLPMDEAIAGTPPAPKVAYKFGKQYIMGRFEPREHPAFVPVPVRYCSRPGMYLRKEVLAAFKRLHQAAAKDGIQLTIRSATRNFYAQKRIWEDKWTGRKLIAGRENLAQTTPDPVLRAKKILRYSAMPGSSRHHWGTDIDLNNLANSYFKKGKGYKMYQWMLRNAHRYGFYQVYTAGRDRGYYEERWHWTYLPTSKEILAEAVKILRDEDFTGFRGANTATKIGIVKNYVLGINPQCLPASVNQ